MKALTPAPLTYDAGLPVYLATPSCRSVSNHVGCLDIASPTTPACPAIFGLRPGIAGSSQLPAESSSFAYGPTVRLRLLSTPPSTTVSLTSIDHVAAWASIELSHDGASQDMAQRGDGIGHVTLSALGCRAGCNLGVGKPLLIERSFF